MLLEINIRSRQAGQGTGRRTSDHQTPDQCVHPPVEMDICAKYEEILETDGPPENTTPLGHNCHQRQVIKMIYRDRLASM